MFLPRGNGGEALCSQEIFEWVKSQTNVFWAKLPHERVRSGKSEHARERFVHAKVYRFFQVQPKREIRDLPTGALGDELVAAAEREAREDALEVVSRARDLLPYGVTVRVELERGRATGRILGTATGEGSDLIVLGARGRTLRGDRFLQGSTADRIIENAHCAVLVAREVTPAERITPTNGELTVGAAR